MLPEHVAEFGVRKAELVEAACSAREHGYSYRGFTVGASVLAWNGTEYRIFAGANIKPAAGAHKTCAETVAISAAHMTGFHLVVALVTCGIPLDAAKACTIHPCETCRAMLVLMPGIQQDSILLTTNAVTGAQEEWTVGEFVARYTEEDVSGLWQHHHENVEWLSDAVRARLRQHAAAHPIVAIFGGVSPPRLPSVLDKVFGSRLRARHNDTLQLLGYALADAECGVVTGACPGASESVQRAHMEHRADKQCVSIGVHRKGLSTEQRPHNHLDVLLDCGTFGPRLAMFWRLSDAAIVLPGGIGTILELLYFVQKNQRTGRVVPLYVASGSDYRMLRFWIGLLKRKGFVEARLQLPLFHCNPLDVPARLRDDLRRLRGN